MHNINQLPNNQGSPTINFPIIWEKAQQFPSKSSMFEFVKGLFSFNLFNEKTGIINVSVVLKSIAHTNHIHL